MGGEPVELARTVDVDAVDKQVSLGTKTGFAFISRLNDVCRPQGVKDSRTFDKPTAGAAAGISSSPTPATHSVIFPTYMNPSQLPGKWGAAGLPEGETPPTLHTTGCLAKRSA